MESARLLLLDAGLELLGRVGFRGWSMRGVEDDAGVPHGTARHHFGNQRGLVSAMIIRLMEIDEPAGGESIGEQVTRWLGSEVNLTRARYELIVASFHDDDLARELVRARDRLVAVLAERGHSASQARQFSVALDGLVLDALLRGEREPAVTPELLQARFLDGT